MFRLEQFGDHNYQDVVINTEMQGELKGVQAYINACIPSLVIVESSPIYAHPSIEYLEQAINHPSSLYAQMVATHIMSDIRSLGIPTQHWVMLDDVNNGASPGEDIFEAFLAETSSSPMYHDITHLAWESHFQYQQKDQCGLMDARFQLSKLREATRHFTQLESFPMLLTIHPVGFQNQQRLMLESLRALMKSDPDACVLQLPKTMKGRLALEPFLHIWTDEQGIDSITMPQMVKGSIQHVAILDI